MNDYQPIRLAGALLGVTLLSGCATEQGLSSVWPDASGLTLCCHDFGDTLQRRIYPTLVQAPGVTDVRRVGDSAAVPCYRLRYSGRREALEQWLQENLRTSETVPYRAEWSRDGSTLDLLFDGGFE